MTKEERAVALVIEKLREEHTELPEATVTAVVRNVHEKFRHVRVRDLIPVLVERFSARELTTLAS